MRNQLSSRRARSGRRDRAERGAATTSFLITMVPVFVLLVGMAFDFAQAYTAKTRALNIAEQAARAGAQELDLIPVYQSGTFQIDTTAAYASAKRFLSSAGRTGTVTFGTDAAGRQTVVVTTEWSSPNAFLSIINLPPFEGSATASARIAVGVDNEVP